MSKPSISVIIVSWNTKELLRTCIKRLQQQRDVDVTICVVDNNSSDGTQIMLQNEFTNAKIILNTKNRGFAAANNQFLSLTATDFTILVNADTEITSQDALLQLVKAHTRTGAGIIGPHLINPDQTTQKSVRGFPSVVSQICILLKLHLIFPNLPALKRYTLPHFDYSQEQQVDQVSGAFFSITKQCKKNVGVLDEQFWIWFEEVDYCKRAYEKGFTVWYTPHVSVIHYGAQSFSQILPAHRQKMFNASLQKYAKKNFGFMGLALIYLASWIGMTLAYITPQKIRPSTYRKRI